VIDANIPAKLALLARLMVPPADVSTCSPVISALLRCGCFYSAERPERYAWRTPLADRP
jgi:hypothetical protein